MLQGSVFVTGGAGFLGRGIIARAHRDGWPCTFTVYSRDPVKQQAVKREFPGVRCILGDVRDYERLELAMAGHETVIHAAAMKHIPEAEANPTLTYEINVDGSRNVATAAMVNAVGDVVGISTDKACHPVNAYGTTKFMLERAFQEAALQGETRFHLVRYGNVIGSTGSVITDWRRKLAECPARIETTEADMSRFWLTVDQAVELIVRSLSEPTGTVFIPKLPAASMDDLEHWFIPAGTEIVHKGLRPGEKRHEELLTVEESVYAFDNPDHFQLWPTGAAKIRRNGCVYISADPDHFLTREEVLAMAGLAE